MFNRSNTRDISSDDNSLKPGKLKIPDSLSSNFQPKKINEKESVSSREIKRYQFHFIENNVKSNVNNVIKVDNTTNIDSISCANNFKINDYNKKDKKDNINVKDRYDKGDIEDIKDSKVNIESNINDTFFKDSYKIKKVIEVKNEIKNDMELEKNKVNKTIKENKQKNDKKTFNDDIWNIDNAKRNNLKDIEEENKNELEIRKQFKKDEIIKEETKKEEKRIENEIIEEENRVKDSFSKKKNLNEKQGKINDDNKINLENKEKNDDKGSNIINKNYNCNLIDYLYEDIKENETGKNLNNNTIDNSELNKFPSKIENKQEEIKNPQSNKLTIINLPKKNKNKEISKNTSNDKLKKIILYDRNTNINSSKDVKNTDYEKTTRETSFKKILRKSNSGKIFIKRKSECIERTDNSQLMVKPPLKINEIFLDSVDFEHYLKSLEIKGLKYSKRETFCEGFFVASFPYKNGKVVENSQNFPATCGHSECSKLLSMKPEIIMRYPLTDTNNLELNNLAATLCFPTGIKCVIQNKSHQI